ncbi:MAG: DUF4411 family protein [Hyphomicrobiales bacterium]|nr:DUF4411 family protein [Hyphomicrobiales bacterium]
MLYLLDANVLISAHRNYCPIDRRPQFWEWLIREGAAGHAKVPLEIYNEIADGNDLLAKWVTEKEVINALVLNEEIDRSILNRVFEQAYGLNMDDIGLDEADRDPFLVAYALMGGDRCVVTKETSEPLKSRRNRKVPDACNDLGVLCVTDLQFYRERGFRIE